ncbi:hypothetical protein ACFP2T_39530 [Plantactinospora solaniradicis]|uniref:DUF2871 domain-containing protein n=1 Tax=Plantactinospora solaniradicis TaxID=1723736 RepID=A0ABW1KKJ0_9ACTN
MTQETTAPPVRRKVTDTLIAISWLTLLGVMFGGYSLLRLLTEIGIDAHAEQFFRAGHAHAGILTAIGILYVMSANRAGLSDRATIISFLVYFTGMGLLSGGFFVHMALGSPGKSSLGTSVMAPVGSVLLATAIVYLTFRLFRRRS